MPTLGSARSLASNLSHASPILPSFMSALPSRNSTSASTRCACAGVAIAIAIGTTRSLAIVIEVLLRLRLACLTFIGFVAGFAAIAASGSVTPASSGVSTASVGAGGGGVGAGVGGGVAATGVGVGAAGVGDAVGAVDERVATTIAGDPAGQRDPETDPHASAARRRRCGVRARGGVSVVGGSVPGIGVDDVPGNTERKPGASGVASATVGVLGPLAVIRASSASQAAASSSIDWNRSSGDFARQRSDELVDRRRDAVTSALGGAAARAGARR